MTNFEKWKDEILKIKREDYEVAVKDGVPKPCVGICNKCEFERESPCSAKFVEWLLAEYQEPAPKLTKREREFLECFSAKDRKAISRYTGGKLAVINTTYSLCEAEINSEMFPFVGSDKVWMFEDLLKLEVEE